MRKFTVRVGTKTFVSEFVKLLNTFKRGQPDPGAKAEYGDFEPITEFRSKSVFRNFWIKFFIKSMRLKKQCYYIRLVGMYV